MAEFNPQVPVTQDPNYFHYTRPIGDIPANKSSAMLLDTAATGIESAAGIVKKGANDYINKDVRDTVEPIRDQFTSSLEQARNSVIPQPVQTAGGSKALSFGAEEEDRDHSAQPLPSAITKGLDQVESIQGSFVNNKINDTYYHQRLSTAVTQLRARYPGFVDEIDSKVSEITGVKPANAYIADMMQDINRAQTSKKTEEDKLLDIARTKGMQYDKGDSMYWRLRGDPSFAPTYLKWLNTEQAKRSTLELDDMERNNLKGRKDVQDRTNKEYLSDFFRSSVDSDLNATVSLTGMKEGMTFSGIIEDAAKNPGKYSPQQMEEFATRVQSQEANMKVQLKAQAITKGYKVADADMDAALDSATRVYGIMGKAIGGGGATGPGLAMALANQTRAMGDMRTASLSKGDLGEWYDNVEFIQKKLGTTVAGVLMPDILKNSEGLKATGALLSKQVTGAIAQSDPNKPTTLAQHTAEVNALLKQKRITLEDKGYHLDKLVNVVDYLKNSEVPLDVKSDIVKYMFHPENNTFLQNFKADYTTTDPTGRLKVEHPGKQTVLLHMINKDITKGIAGLDSQSQQMYANWVDTTTREVIGEDVRNLAHATGHDNIKFIWNGKDKTLSIDPKSKGLESPVGKPASPFATSGYGVNQGYLDQIERSVKNINKITPSLGEVYKSFGGGDTEATLIHAIQRYGMDNLGSISGLPKAIGDAIAASRKPVKEEPAK